jgi:DNA-binding GntR family transcriptional regulator
MSTVDVVQGAVMSDMLRGSLPPGTWIRQDEVALRLGVSKIPVREALQRLSASGLVRFEANRGAVVPKLSADDAEENYSLRQAIEVRLLQQALPRLGIVELAEAEIALSGGTDSLTEANWQFHRALYRASGWERGLAMAEILHAAVAPYVVLYTEGLGGAADSDAEHVALLAACREGDVDRAVALLDQHLQGAASALIEFLRA